MSKHERFTPSKSHRVKGLECSPPSTSNKEPEYLPKVLFSLLAERPELSLLDPYASNDISEAFDRLPAHEQFNFMGLHCPKRTGCGVLVSIYEANSYEMGSGTCICLDASRINHSCLPNAHYSWNASTKRIAVHAVKDTFQGEEITITYCSAIRTLEERKRKLKLYVFTCRCPSCQDDTVFGIMTQIRRRQMLDLDREIADYQNDPATARAEHGRCDEQSAILKLLRLLDKEGLVYETSLAYHDAAEWALKQGFRVKALAYAREELDVDLCCVEPDSPSYEEKRSFFRRTCLGTDKV